MAKKKTNKNESVHVRLNAPVAKRKIVLGMAIDTVELVKKYDNIKQIQAEKEREFHNFRTILKSLTKLSKTVKMKEVNLPKPKRTATHKKKVSKPVQRKSVEHHGIDAQLDALRKKLESL